MEQDYSTEAPAEYAGMSIPEIVGMCDEWEQEEAHDRAWREGRA